MKIFEEQSKHFEIYVQSFKGSQKGEMLWYSILYTLYVSSTLYVSNTLYVYISIWIVFHLPE